MSSYTARVAVTHHLVVFIPGDRGCKNSKGGLWTKHVHATDRKQEVTPRWLGVTPVLGSREIDP